MEEGKSNSDSGESQNKEPIRGDRNNQEKKNIIDNITGQDTNINEGDSSEQPLSDNNNASGSIDVKSLADKVTDINRLRYELDRLQLDFKARAYFENDIRPLIDSLYTLSYASINYSTTASNMTNTNFGHGSKIKNALDLAEEVNEISEGLVDVLRYKIENMLKLSRYDCK